MSLPINGAPVDIFVSLSSILTTIFTISAVVGSIFILIRYLRKNVTAAVLEVGDKMETQKRQLQEEMKRNQDRLEHLREIITLLEKRIEDNHFDVNNKFNEIKTELVDVKERLDKAKDEYNKISNVLAVEKEELRILLQKEKKMEKQRGLLEKDDFDEDSKWW